MARILSAEEVCELIDLYPNVPTEVAKVMKAAVRRGECPPSLTTSLRLTPVIMFEQHQSFCQCGHPEDGHVGVNGACTSRWMIDKKHPSEVEHCPCTCFQKRNPMTTKEKERISKFMSLVLRHKPEAAFCTLTSDGWCSISELRIGMAATGHSISDEDLLHVVNDNDKKRFEISADGKNIRAVQGHTVEVDLKYTATQPPAFLYHGTATRFIDSIKAQGLVSGARQHVHLSETRETANTVGARHGKPAIIKVLSGSMWESGTSFFQAANGVWLVKAVPTEYLKFDEMFEEKLDE